MLKLFYNIFWKKFHIYKLLHIFKIYKLSFFYQKKYLNRFQIELKKVLIIKLIIIKYFHA